MPITFLAKIFYFEGVTWIKVLKSELIEVNVWFKTNIYFLNIYYPKNIK